MKLFQKLLNMNISKANIGDLIIFDVNYLSNIEHMIILEIYLKEESIKVFNLTNNRIHCLYNRHFNLLEECSIIGRVN